MLGTVLMMREVVEGMCMVDLTSFIYFAFYTPIVYVTFLKGYLADGGRRGNLFSYRLQQDDDEEQRDIASPVFQVFISSIILLPSFSELRSFRCYKPYKRLAGLETG